MTKRHYLVPNQNMIFAALNSRNLGDFVEELLIAATVKENLERSKLGVFYVDDRPYKKFIASLYPGLDYSIVGKADTQFPINIFDSYSDQTISNDTRVENTGLVRSRIILAGSALISNTLPSFDHVARLSLPENSRREEENRLRDLGLDPNRWFACFFWREPGFLTRTSLPLRDIVDPSPYIETMEHVIHTLGGQVVRLGHPTDTVIPTHPDLIDLSSIEDSLAAQIVAISRARYLVSSCSGPITFGPGFGVPTAATDAIENSSIWNDDDILLTQKIVGPRGRIYQQKSTLDAGLLGPGTAKRICRPGGEYTYIKNNANELKYVTDLLHARTEGCSKWREPEFRETPTPKASLAFPLQPSIKIDSLVDIPVELHD